MVVELAGVTKHQQMLVLVLLADATATGKHVTLCINKVPLLLFLLRILKRKSLGM